jgi:hypothetical protein
MDNPELLVISFIMKSIYLYSTLCTDSSNAVYKHESLRSICNIKLGLWPIELLFTVEQEETKAVSS